MDYEENVQFPRNNTHQSTARHAPPSLLPAVLSRLGLADEPVAQQVPLEVLLASLENDNWSVRVAAVRMLGKLGEHAPIEPLIAALKDEDGSVRAAAVRGLGLLGKRAPIDRLIAMLNDDDWHVRETAVLALGKLAAQVPIEPLLAALNDKDACVREATAVALRSIYSDGSSGIAPSFVSTRAVYTSEISPSTQASDSRTVNGEQDIIPSLRLKINFFDGLLSHLDSITRPFRNVAGKIFLVDVGHLQENPAPPGEQNSTVSITHLESERSRTGEGRPSRGRFHFHFGRRVAVGLALLVIIANSIVWFALTHNHQLHTGTGGQITNTPTPAKQYIPTTIVCHANASITPGAPITSVQTVVSSAPIGTLLHTYHGHSNGIAAVAWSPDGSRIATGSWDQTLQVWDAFTTERYVIYRGHHGDIADLSWSPDGKYIASTGSFDDTMQVWDATTGKPLLTCTERINNHGPNIGHYMNAVAWSPDGTRIAFVSSADGDVDNKVQVLDVATDKFIFTDHPKHFVMALAWSPSSKRIAAAGYDGTVQVLDANNGKLIFTYQGHASTIYGGVSDVAWSPNGKYIASAGINQTVQVWDAYDGHHLFTYQGHTTGVSALTWSPDSKRIASAAAETIQVWDAFTGAHVYIYGGHTRRVTDLAWSPDGTRIVSVSGANGQGEVQLWQAN